MYTPSRTTFTFESAKDSYSVQCYLPDPILNASATFQPIWDIGEVAYLEHPPLTQNATLIFNHNVSEGKFIMRCTIPALMDSSPTLHETFLLLRTFDLHVLLKFNAHYLTGLPRGSSTSFLHILLSVVGQSTDIIVSAPNQTSPSLTSILYYRSVPRRVSPHAWEKWWNLSSWYRDDHPMQNHHRHYIHGEGAFFSVMLR